MDTQTMYALARALGADFVLVRIVAIGPPDSDDEWHAMLTDRRSGDNATGIRVGIPSALCTIEARGNSPGAAFDELGRVMERAVRAEQARINGAAETWLREVAE